MRTLFLQHIPMLLETISTSCEQADTRLTDIETMKETDELFNKNYPGLFIELTETHQLTIEA